MRPYELMVRREMKGVSRSAPFELLRFVADSAEKHITPTGEITISFDDVERIIL